MAEGLAEATPDLRIVEKPKAILIDQALEMQLVYLQTLESLSGISPLEKERYNKAQGLIAFLREHADMFMDQLEPEERAAVAAEAAQLSQELTQKKEEL
ncbi:MAG TPA: hypothetical protein VLE51_03815 [Candidatus Saccharimonadales bacterium]|nr:hypothetical protein [Candidatus Saccharimonadales bacterium]